MRDGPLIAPTVETLSERLAEVRERIDAAGGSADRVTVIGVTKTFPIEFVVAAQNAGLIDVGENYAQDLARRHDEAAALGVSPRWHFIGGLQRNKVKLLAGKVTLWQTVDRPSLVAEIAKRDAGASILIQVNTTGEAQKSGCPPDETEALMTQAVDAGLTVRGLMTIGPTGGGDPRPSFEALRTLGERLSVEELSMGMSADYERAVAAGSTMVRVGSALFGPRRT
ncbi:MAG: YggS family pyridoxal phosphate-dependent enzyme [Actinomycetota bacterium]